MKLDVHLLGLHCGVLTIEEERFQFDYRSAYLESGGPALSASMPVETQHYGDAIAFPFFENLLPEGDVRDLLAERLETSSNNLARLLERTGGEVAGAVTLFIAGQAPDQNQAPPSEALDNAALGKLFEQLKSAPFLASPDSAMRLSLAGAQSKLPVLVDKQGIRLPGSHPSSHILKPPSQRFPGLVEIEYLCMRAAAQAGLTVPPVNLIPFRNYLDEEHYALQIRRYDRISTAHGMQRLHQEDLCQVLGIPSARKYAQDGGPDVRAVFSAVRTHTRTPALNLRELILRLFFNLLIGNCDAHAKNFSLFHLSGGIKLAPAYDLVCTQAWPELSTTLAMPIGSANSICDIDKAALQNFSTDVEIGILRQQSALLRFVERAYEALLAEAAVVMEECYRDEKNTVTRAIALFDQHYAVLAKALR